MLGVMAVIFAAVVVFFWPSGDSLFKPLLKPGPTISAVGHGKGVSHLAWPALVIAIVVLARKLVPGVQSVARWIDNPRSESAKGSMHDVNRQLGWLIGQGVRAKRRLIIFVDNLERCRPPRAVDVCEVVSQLISHQNVVTVLIGDMDTIASSAEVKYASQESIPPGHDVSSWVPKTAGRRVAGAYGRAYLEKLIQIQLTLPPPLINGLREMLSPGTHKRPDAFLPYGRARNPPSLLKNALLIFSVLAIFAAFAAYGAFTILNPPRPPSSSLPIHVEIPWWQQPSVLFILFPIGFFAAFAVRFGKSTTSEQIQQREIKRRRNAVDKVISNEVDFTETTLRQDVVEKVAQQVVKKTDDYEIREYADNEISRRIRQHIISGSDLRTELDHAVLKILPLSPRAAKRMFNHAHLLLDIGVERGIFDSKRTLRVGQLAAWVGLTERWPSVAAEISKDPELIGKLEKAAREASLIVQPEQLTALENEIRLAGLDTNLLDYLRQTDPLFPVIHLLVNFSPVTDEKPTLA
jgi:KAP family P-loop domain